MSTLRYILNLTSTRYTLIHTVCPFCICSSLFFVRRRTPRVLALDQWWLSFGNLWCLATFYKPSKMHPTKLSNTPFKHNPFTNTLNFILTFLLQQPAHLATLLSLFVYFESNSTLESLSNATLFLCAATTKSNTRWWIYSFTENT